jgi:uncharacterized protein YndB with AHSA1/START domain
MSTCVLHPDKLPRILAHRRQLVDDAWHLTVTSCLNADRNRIFQALTVPEYIEAWFCTPGDSLRQPSVSLTQNGFRIKHCARLGADIDILGFYMMLRRSKLLFTWQRKVAANSPTSLVFIRLYGEFTRTRMRLYHVGLKSVEEHEWHQEMWEASLSRLNALFK